MSNPNKENQEQFIPSDINIYAKSNYLISSKYRSSLLENKIQAYSLSRASFFDVGESERETIKSVISVNELRKALGANSGSFYSQLRNTAAEMTGKSIGMSSPDSSVFDYIAVVTRATCKDGVFTIEYNGAMRKVLLNLQKNYSKLNLSIMMKFRNNYAFRLYELLKSKTYRVKGDPNTSKEYHIRFQLSELRLELGVVNSDLDSVRKVLRSSEHPDYDKAVEVSPEKIFEDWYEFRRNVIEKAVNEINKITDLQVSYDVVKRGTKVTGVDFTVIDNSDHFARDVEEPEKKRLSSDEEGEFIFKLRDTLGRGFSFSELRSIAEQAGWEMAPIWTAYEIYKDQKGIDNPTGWMISAIKNGYSSSNKKEEEKKRKRGKKKNSGFEMEREFDPDLEKILLEN